MHLPAYFSCSEAICGSMLAFFSFRVYYSSKKKVENVSLNMVCCLLIHLTTIFTIVSKAHYIHNCLKSTLYSQLSQKHTLFTVVSKLHYIHNRFIRMEMFVKDKIGLAKVLLMEKFLSKFVHK